MMEDEAFDPATQLLMERELDAETLTAGGSLADFSRCGKRQRSEHTSPEPNNQFGPRFMDCYKQLQREVAESTQSLAGVRACEILSRLVGFHIRDLCTPGACVICLDS
jgi:hypothetical protein